MSATLIDYMAIADFLEEHWTEWCEQCCDENIAQEQIDLLREFANEDN